MAFLQVPAWCFHGAGSRAGLRGWSWPEEKGKEVWEGRHRGAGGEERTTEMTMTGPNCNLKKGDCRISEGVAAQAGEGGQWCSVCWLLGTWPAMSDVGRKTPESTSLKRGWQHKDRCVSLLPIPFFPSSPNLFTQVQKTASQSRGAG